MPIDYGYPGDLTGGGGQLTAANTNRDGTGDLVLLFTAPEGGALFQRATFAAAGATTAGVVRLFITSPSGTTRLYSETLVTAITPGVATAVWTGEVFPTTAVPMLPGEKLYGSTHNAETFNVRITASKMAL